MKPASGTMISNLATYQNFWVANLFTITLLDGTVLRYTDFQSPVKLSGNTFSDAGPYPLWSGFSQKIGVEVDEAKMQLWALYTNLVESTAVLQLFGQGAFDGADVLVQRCIMPDPNDGSVPRPINFDTSAGAVTLMHGNISDINELDASHADFAIKSKKELLNIPFPWRTYQPSCQWTLYGAGCTLNQASFEVSGTVSAGSNNLLLNTDLTNVNGDFTEGVITFTSGANSGVSRTVRLYQFVGTATPAQVLLWLALPNTPAPGDSFTIVPGCDKQKSTCEIKFGNLINHGGFEFIPVAEAGI